METTTPIPSLQAAPPLASFSPDEHAGRLAATRAEMRLRGLDLLVVVSPENIYHLLGLNHQGYFAFTLMLLPLTGPPTLVARQMEGPTIAAQAPACSHAAFSDAHDAAVTAADAIADLVPAGSRIGVECNGMFFPILTWEHIRTSLSDRQWFDASDLVEQIRMIKSPAEIALVRRAAVISDRAMAAGVAAAGPGVTETAVAASVYRELIASGSDYPGFAPCIRGADILRQEHVTWRDRPLPYGSGLFLELSASAGRYHAPLTRLVHMGRSPAGGERIAETAIAGLTEVTERLRPGAVASDVYAAWQKVVSGGLGHNGYHRHHCGYLVGIGFPPSWVGGSQVVGIRPDSGYVIQAGMVFHVLSWIIDQPPADYVVSDTVLVTETGSEVLTTFPRGPLTVV
ncbi:MAG: M24 family metallopeptidase [Micromonosporaceae bacterium]|nr:M24 family metallopeptidase [Micromonosporaceae bacterium]